MKWAQRLPNKIKTRNLPPNPPPPEHQTSEAHTNAQAKQSTPVPTTKRTDPKFPPTLPKSPPWASESPPPDSRPSPPPKSLKNSPIPNLVEGLCHDQPYPVSQGGPLHAYGCREGEPADIQNRPSKTTSSRAILQRLAT